LADGLYPDPLEELMHSPDPQPQRGPTSKGGKEGEGPTSKGREGREGRGLLLRGTERREGRREGMEGRVRELPPPKVTVSRLNIGGTASLPRGSMPVADLGRGW